MWKYEVKIKDWCMTELAILVNWIKKEREYLMEIKLKLWYLIWTILNHKGCKFYKDD